MKTILIVEDNEKHRIFFRKALELGGFSVNEATNGLEALEILRNENNNIDMVIVDYSMPKMNGLELMKIIRVDTQIKSIRKKNKKDNHIPVIVITVYVTSDDVKEMKINADEFIPKPLSYKDVLKAVRKY